MPNNEDDEDKDKDKDKENRGVPNRKVAADKGEPVPRGYSKSARTGELKPVDVTWEKTVRVIEFYSDESPSALRTRTDAIEPMEQEDKDTAKTIKTLTQKFLDVLFDPNPNRYQTWALSTEIKILERDLRLLRKVCMEIKPDLSADLVNSFNQIYDILKSLRANIEKTEPEDITLRLQWTRKKLVSLIERVAPEVVPDELKTHDTRSLLRTRGNTGGRRSPGGRR